jgi:hypothetical protein
MRLKMSSQEGRKMSDEEIERVADRVFEKIQAQIGRNAIMALIWAIGVAALAILTYFGIINRTHAAEIAFRLGADHGNSLHG